jgi:uncharacterized OB-fold protein
MEHTVQTSRRQPEALAISRRSHPPRLLASRDRASGQCVFPRVPDRSPASSRYEPVELSPLATLYSFTVIHPNPKTGEKAFVVIYADFPEGARVFGRLQLPAEVRPVIGMRLEVRLEGSGDSYFFTPAEEVTP